MVRRAGLEPATTWLQTCEGSKLQPAAAGRN